MNLLLIEHSCHLFHETEFGNTGLNNYFLIVTELNYVFKFLIVCACDQTIFSQRTGFAKIRSGPQILSLYEQEKIFFLFVNQSTLTSMPTIPENFT